MATYQDTFQTYRDQAYEGQISDIGVNDIISPISNESSDNIGFGLFVIDGGADGKGKLPTDKTAFELKDVLGVSVRSMALENDSSDVPGYKPKTPMSLLRRGRIFVKCNGGCTRRNTVHVSYDATAGGLGSCHGSTVASKTVELKNVRWLTDGADGDIVEIQVDGIF
ncbi:hypothetical protein [Vibrio phage vB_VpM-pA2SJ1]|uniref:Uncharacterized protein n=1 Tax=Vibrio phage vB_VpM-pA2SJ1 TaxID=3095964 RepID=A0AAX4J5W1_9CAUD